MMDKKHHIKDISWNEQDQVFKFTSRSGRFEFNMPNSNNVISKSNSSQDSLEVVVKRDVHYYDNIERIIELPGNGKILIIRFSNGMSCVVKVEHQIQLETIFKVQDKEKNDEEDDSYKVVDDMECNQSVYKRDLKERLEDGQPNLSKKENGMVQQLMKANEKGYVSYITEHRVVHEVVATENFAFIIGDNYVSVSRLESIQDSLGDIPYALDTRWVAVSKKDHIAFKENDANHVYIYHFSPNMHSLSQPQHTLVTFKEPMQHMTLSPDGSILVIANKEGNDLYVYKKSSPTDPQIFRRGRNPALIHCLVISNDNRYLACYSSRGTIHIFSFENEENQRSMWSSIPMVNQFTSVNHVWSMTKYTSTVLLRKGISKDYTRTPAPGILSFEKIANNYRVRLLTIKGNLVGFDFTCHKKEDGTPTVTQTSNFEFQLWWDLYERDSNLTPIFLPFEKVLDELMNLSHPEAIIPYVPILLANWCPHPMLENNEQFQIFLSDAQVREETELARIRCFFSARLSNLAEVMQKMWHIRQIKFLAKKSLVQLVTTQPLFPLYHAFHTNDGVLQLTYQANYEAV